MQNFVVALHFKQGRFYNAVVADETATTVTSKLTKRGQTTLPSAVRKRLHASAGDTLEYTLTDEGVLLRVKQPDLGVALEDYLGVFTGESYADAADALAKAREARGWDEEDAKLFERWAEE